LTPPVHILATCLNEALLDATLLVFRTLRAGFTSNAATVWLNGLSPAQAARVAEAAAQARCATVPVARRIAHDAWIAGLLDRGSTPFWIADTDLVFWRPLPSPPTDTFLAGRYEPPFREPWSKTDCVARLHTSLLYLDPPRIRALVREWAARWHPAGFPFQPQFELIHQHFMPQSGQPPFFYDTCAGLYQAIGGTPFSDEQNACFEHLHCGTYSDRIATALPGLPAVHASVIKATEAARGLSKSQAEYYRLNPSTSLCPS